MVILGLLIIITTGQVASAQDRPRIIKVLAMGKASSTPTMTQWLVAEPSTDPTIIATRVWGAVSGSDIKRYMRIYFPRTAGEFSSYEFLFLAQVDMTYIDAGQTRLIYDGLGNNPMGAVNTRSTMSAVSTYYMPWRDSILPEAFPNDVDAVIADRTNFQGLAGPLVIKDDPLLPNIVKPYKSIESVYPNYYGVNTIPKPGSIILTYTKNSQGVGSPIPGQIAHIFYWRWRNSTTFTFRDMVGDLFWAAPAGNPYSMDIVANVIWFGTGRDLPQDPLMVHDYRQLVSDYTIRKSLLTSLLDFAEIFGADSSGIHDRSGEAEEFRIEAAQSYLDGEFVEAHETMTLAMVELEELEEDAAKLKDSALFWVYLVQWLTTTGTFLVAGFVLWSLMIRRSLYRDVSSTRWVD
jgi:hypothetical protein